MSSGIRSVWPQVVGQAWADEDFRRRLFENPKAAFEDIGLEIPAGHRIEVLEDTPSCTHLVLPPKPDTLDSLVGAPGISLGGSADESAFACTQSPILACTQSPILACTQSPINACTQSPINACTQSPINACTQSPGKKY